MANTYHQCGYVRSNTEDGLVLVCCLFELLEYCLNEAN